MRWNDSPYQEHAPPPHHRSLTHLPQRFPQQGHLPPPHHQLSYPQLTYPCHMPPFALSPLADEVQRLTYLNASLNKDTYLHLTTVHWCFSPSPSAPHLVLFKQRCNDSLTTKDTYLSTSPPFRMSALLRINSCSLFPCTPIGTASNFELFIFGTPLNGTASNFELFIFGTPLNGTASNFELFIFGTPLNTPLSLPPFPPIPLFPHIPSFPPSLSPTFQGAASNFELFIFGTPLNESTEQSGSSVRVVLRAPNGLFLQARTDGSLTADLQQSLSNDAIWSSAAAFDLTVLWRVEGDFQAAFTAGTAAPTIYENIRRNFLTEADWQKMQELGINTVRIPLAYWIALDATPEFPFVPGAATYLDWAFEMGAKYGVRIWFSVHVAPGSQAGKGNARDGLIRWRGENVNRTLDFVTWLANRYGADPMWLGMGLLNEPVVPGANGYAGVDLEDMRGYYSAGFNAIRARCLCCFVAMEGRVGSNFGDVMWHMSDAWHNNVLLEQHIYEVFGNFFSSKGVDWEIEYAHTTRKDNIIAFQQKVGRNLLVGEFCNAMGNSATSEQQANFSLGQMKAFSHAKAGWFFWSWKLNTTGTCFLRLLLGQMKAFSHAKAGCQGSHFPFWFGPAVSDLLL
ncbi:unnamed protein product [Closterium sp. Naga37s-1]|nr:unnamed protein product [Closterium sp. Naga37s-1]